jgi:outer membrane protein
MGPPVPIVHRQMRRLKTGTPLVIMGVAAGLLPWQLGLAQEAIPVDMSGFELRLGKDEARQEVANTDLRLARAQYLPKISIGTDWDLQGKIDYSPELAPDSTSSYAEKEPTSVGAEVSWRLFDGLKRWNDVKTAEALVAAGAETLVDTKQKLLLEKATVILAVIRDRSIVAAQATAIGRQRKALDTSRAMLKDQSMTISDVALSASQLEGAQATYAQAKGALAASEIAFRKLTGVLAPKKLSLAIPSAKMPRSANEAAERSRLNSPLPRMAEHIATAADYKADAAKSMFFPTVDMVGKYTMTFNSTPAIDQVNSYALLLRVRMPILEPSLKPNLDRARAEAMQRDYDVQDTYLSVAMAARGYFEARKAMTAQANSLERQVAQARKAANGMQIEREAGTRTVVDIANAESGRINSEVALANIRYERDLAAFNLLAVMGELDDSDLPSWGSGSTLAQKF